MTQRIQNQEGHHPRDDPALLDAFKRLGGARREPTWEEHTRPVEIISSLTNNAELGEVGGARRVFCFDQPRFGLDKGEKVEFR